MATLTSGSGYDAQSIFTTILLLLVIVLSSGYAYFQAQKLIAGPAIAFISPSEPTVVNESVLEVRGTAERIAFLELDGKQIYIDETGIFEEKLILSPGVNIIKLEAQDRFGRDVSRQLHIFYDEEPSSDPSTN